MWYALSDIRCMRRDFRSDDALLNIFQIGQRQVFSGRHIAEEGSAAHSRYGTTDRGRDVIISRSDIGYQRAQYIERRSHAKGLLDLHVGGNLIQRHVTGPFYHDLHVLFPCPLCQFSQTNQLFDLADIRSIRQASGTAGIS